ncbi:unnamed protein product [Strongylus vulgaris]|uniref:Uncharacterized protein n=1 Tax=Strongylus vulgaris TaxID=40348 RepID=A0A3P7JTD5_STRVU|nr:unnamed protein product [Strongylus vulgaris]
MTIDIKHLRMFNILRSCYLLTPGRGCGKSRSMVGALFGRQNFTFSVRILRARTRGDVEEERLRLLSRFGDVYLERDRDREVLLGNSRDLPRLGETDSFVLRLLPLFLLEPRLFSGEELRSRRSFNLSRSSLEEEALWRLLVFFSSAEEEELFSLFRGISSNEELLRRLFLTGDDDELLLLRPLSFFFVNWTEERSVDFLASLYLRERSLACSESGDSERLF